MGTNERDAKNPGLVRCSCLDHSHKRSSQPPARPRFPASTISDEASIFGDGRPSIRAAYVFSGPDSYRLNPTPDTGARTVRAGALPAQAPDLKRSSPDPIFGIGAFCFPDEWRATSMDTRCRCGRTVPVDTEVSDDGVVLKIRQHHPGKHPDGGFSGKSRKTRKYAICNYSGHELPRYGQEE